MYDYYIQNLDKIKKVVRFLLFFALILNFLLIKIYIFIYLQVEHDTNIYSFDVVFKFIIRG